jgi:mannose-6-phosphate isomerase-like protein (cupin superfamily)
MLVAVRVIYIASPMELIAVQNTRFFNAAECELGRKSSGKRYSEFLRVPAMSAGLYVLQAGGVDTQSPHQQDEMYYVVRGRARMRAGSEDQGVSAGSIIFVAARVEHRFYEITEELVLLVMFAPPETE